MIGTAELERIVDTVAPVSAAEEWDNVGLLVDCGNRTDKVLFSLDATPEAIEEAAELGCGIIVTHHPVIFHPLKRIDSRSPVFLAVRKNISVISAHTNFDCADGGVNDELCSILGLEETGKVEGICRSGSLSGEMTVSDFAGFVMKKLGVPHVGMVDTGRKVHRVLVIGGAGGDYVDAAENSGCDTLLTGEVRHHEALEGRLRNINIISAGHYGTENPTVQRLMKSVCACAEGRFTGFLSAENRDPMPIV